MVKAGQHVCMIATGCQAAIGDSGIVQELRGWNWEHGQKVSRYILVRIIRTTNGKPTRRVISCTDREVAPSS